jgi:cytochrome c
MSDLGANKIFGAVLATGLVILGLQHATEVLFHVEAPEKAGYLIEVQEEAAVGGGPVELAPPDWGTVLPTANIAAGETAFGKCLSCHTIAAGGAVLTGPNLHDIVGEKPGVRPGFEFSPAMVEYGTANPIWDDQTLYHYLQAPQRVVRGTKMTFVGVKRQDELINLIAYLRSQSPGAPPIPAPNPAAVATAEGGESATAAEGAPAGEATGAAAAAPAAATAAPTTAPPAAAAAPGH